MGKGRADRPFDLVDVLKGATICWVLCTVFFYYERPM